MTLREWDQRFQRWNVERKRRMQMAAGLAEWLDLLALMMSVGVDFHAAVEHAVARSSPGPLREEWLQYLREVGTGTARTEALQHLEKRNTEPYLKETVRMIVQGLMLGSSLSPLLRSQAQQLRHHRACEAEKRAAQAPLKLMFPLFVFIFPTIFIVLFGPIILQLLSKPS